MAGTILEVSKTRIKKKKTVEIILVKEDRGDKERNGNF